MKTLRTLGAVIALTFVLNLSALGGEIPTPPCSTPEPGQTETPPCSVAQAPTLGELNAPPADRASTLAEIAENVLQSMWSLF